MELTCQVLATDTAPDLLKVFCKFIHVPLKGSRLFHNGAVLTKETMKQVPYADLADQPDCAFNLASSPFYLTGLCWRHFNHVIQVQRSSDGPVHLLATFDCTVAFHTWQSLACGDVLDRAARPAALVTAAQIIIMPNSWEALVNQEVLADLTLLDPSHCIPPQATLWSLQQILKSSCPAAVKLMLVLLNHFQTSKHRAIKIITESHRVSPHPSPCTASQPSQIAAVAYETLSVIELLKGTLLLFKLIEVANVVEREAAVTALVALWSLVSNMLQAMEAKACSTVEDQWNGAMSEQQHREQLQYSLLLLQMMSTVKQQLVKALSSGSAVRLSMCFAIEGVLIILHHKEVSSHIVQTGKYKRLS